MELWPLLPDTKDNLHPKTHSKTDSGAHHRDSASADTHDNTVSQTAVADAELNEKFGLALICVASPIEYKVFGLGRFDSTAFGRLAGTIAFTVVAALVKEALSN